MLIFRYANQHLNEQISPNYQQPCSVIFANHSFEETMASDQVWGDDQVANLTCRLFNFVVKSYTLIQNVVRCISFGSYHVIAENPGYIVPTGRIIYENNNHFNVIEVI